MGDKKTTEKERIQNTTEKAKKRELRKKNKESNETGSTTERSSCWNFLIGVQTLPGLI